jgi:hypothetical protein
MEATRHSGGPVRVEVRAVLACDQNKRQSHLSNLLAISRLTKQSFAKTGSGQTKRKFQEAEKNKMPAVFCLLLSAP